MVQVPADTMVTVVPDTVQIPVVVLEKDTMRLLSDDALTVKAESPKVLLDRDPKVMVCASLLTANERMTSTAAE